MIYMIFLLQFDIQYPIYMQYSNVTKILTLMMPSFDFAEIHGCTY